MKILVTGASGFIGSKLVPQLCKQGYEVRTFYRGNPAPNDRLEHYSGSITDYKAIVEATMGCDYVFHLAGMVSYRFADKQLQYEVNVLGTRNVMRAALEGKVKRVIHTSSLAALGIPPSGQLGDENIVYNLSGRGLYYCDTKHEAEEEAMKFARLGLPVIILCPGIILGEGDTHPHHRAIFMAASKGFWLGCPSGGVTFCDIDDVVDSHLNAISQGTTGERYVLGSENLTYKQAAAVLSRFLGRSSISIMIPGIAAQVLGWYCEKICPGLGLMPPLTWQSAWLSQKTMFFSFDKAIRELGLNPTPFKKTIEKTAWYYLKG